MTAPMIEAPPSISRKDAFLFWLKLGVISFGGPAGQIGIMHKELVEDRRWISEKRFLHALNYCMLLPGPEAQQLATYLGWLMHKTAGGIIAGTLFVAPSLFLMIGLSALYVTYGHTPLLEGVFYGIKPAVVAIVFHAAYRVGRRNLSNGLLWATATAAFIATAIFSFPFPVLILMALALGGVLGRWRPDLFRAQTHTTPSGSNTPAVIDDDTPLPDHARFRWPSFLKICLTGAMLWALPFAGLGMFFGWHSPFTQMAGFFTSAALVTFGGAYAVIPYVLHQSVSQFGWLTAPQMIDGLALGESTPGPLIMVVVFVAYLGGHVTSPLGPDQAVLSAVLAAVLVTWFTFLPSFIFILAGAPFIEQSQNDLRFGAPLTVVSACIVGVIATLSIFFASHVFWPSGTGSPPDALAIGLTGVAALLLFRLKWSILRTLAICAGTGLAVRLFV